MKRTLGVCYYPEHWPEERWETDALMMVEAGIEIVRVAEFALASCLRAACMLAGLTRPSGVCYDPRILLKLPCY